MQKGGTACKNEEQHAKMRNIMQKGGTGCKNEEQHSKM